MKLYSKEVVPNRVMLLDGNNIAYRAFYAMPEFSSTSGEPVGAVYGFFNILLSLCEKFTPSHIAAFFDKERSAPRLALYPEYKAGRQKMPEDLLSQLKLIEELLSIIQIPIEVAKGHEADDCIASFARSAVDNGCEVFVVSGDRDLMQIIDDKIHIVYPKKSISDNIVYDTALFKEKWGFEPKLMRDYKALAGDSSDNIPGARGIGDVTAKKLLATFGTVEHIYENIDKVPKRAAKLLIESSESVSISKKLVDLLDVPEMQFSEDSKLSEFDPEPFFEFLNRLSFKSFITKFFPDNRGMTSISKPKLSDTDFILLLSDSESSHFTQNSAILSKPTLFDLERLQEIAKEKRLCAFNVKPWIKLFKEHNLDFPENFFDISLAYYLLHPSDGEPELLSMYERVKDRLINASTLSDTERVEMLIAVLPILEERLKAADLWELFLKNEQPILRTLAEMELRGVFCSAKDLYNVSEQLKLKIATLEETIFAIAGEKFNISSNVALPYILYDKLQLPSKKKRSTDYETLMGIVELSPIVPLVLEYREMKKLLNTYSTKLPEEISPVTGRIHTNLSSTSTATGRLSSRHPNLQNIPAGDGVASLIRAAFKPQDPDLIFLSADYSQIELRVMASFSEDEKMISTFKRDLDIHASTASEIFSIPIEQVEPSMRRKAKEINFGILYGMSAFRLSGIIAVSVKMAQEYIDRYFSKFPDVKKFIDRVLSEATKTGYVTTLMGRKRWFTHLKSRNFNQKAGDQRAALNSVIQGSAADIMKQAMLRTDSMLKERGLKAKMILQIHDELLFELPPEEVAPLTELLKESMGNFPEIKVPLKINFKKGKNYLFME